jgi:ComF family protein
MDCKEKLLKNFEERDGCAKCGINKNKHRCSCDKFNDYYFSGAFSFFDYNRDVHDLIHQLKYRSKSRLAYYLGKEFAYLIPDNFLRDADGIIPVPLHFLRQMQRGYNQADYLARGIVEGLNNKLPYIRNVLKRVKYTRTQTKLDRVERHKNLSNAFIVNPRYVQTIQNNKMILVDDVITTGATTSICSEVLSTAGAERTHVISIARG